MSSNPSTLRASLRRSRVLVFGVCRCHRKFLSVGAGLELRYKKMREQHRDVLESDQVTRERTLSQAEDHKDRVKEVVAQQFTTREETANMQKHIALAAELDHLVRHQRANELGSLEQRLLFSDSSQVQGDMDELKDLLYGSEGSPTVRAQGCADFVVSSTVRLPVCPSTCCLPTDG